MKKRMIAIAASMMMVLGLGTAMADDTITLRLSNNQPDGNVTTQACEWFAEQVKERTNGRIEIQVYNNGTLGDAVSCLEQAQYGGMDIIKADLSTMTNFVDDYNALMMPYRRGERQPRRVSAGRNGAERRSGRRPPRRAVYRAP